MRYGIGTYPFPRAILLLAITLGASGPVGVASASGQFVLGTLPERVAEPDPKKDLCELRRRLGLPCDLSNTAPLEAYYLAVEEAYEVADLDAMSVDERLSLIMQILLVREGQTPMPPNVSSLAYWRFMALLEDMLTELEV